MVRMRIDQRAILALTVGVMALMGCGETAPSTTEDAPAPAQGPLVQTGDRWSIYSLDLASERVDLLYSAPDEISSLRLDSAGERFAFAQMTGGTGYEFAEIYTLDVDGSDLRRLTDNDVWDLYPAWSPDGTEIAFLTFRGPDLDIYTMSADGEGQALLYDSGDHDADIHWSGDQIVFTSGSRVWIMQQDGTGVRPLTDPPRAGEWGEANLPFGDYDPRISPDGARVIFERMVDDRSPHGNYDLFTVDTDGSNLIRLTETGYSQGLANWSHAGDRIVYLVSAIGDEGQYDVYLMNADGTGSRDITPDAFPPRLLCHWAVFSPDGTVLYLIAEWWPEE